MPNGLPEQRDDEDDFQYIIRCLQRVGHKMKEISGLQDRVDKVDDRSLKNWWVAQGALWMTGVALTAAVTLIVSDAVSIWGDLRSRQGETRAADQQADRSESVRDYGEIMIKADGLGANELREQIREGKFDGQLKQLERWERRHDKRQSVLVEIYKRRLELGRLDGSSK